MGDVNIALLAESALRGKLIQAIYQGTAFFSYDILFFKVIGLKKCLIDIQDGAVGVQEKDIVLDAVKDQLEMIPHPLDLRLFCRDLPIRIHQLVRLLLKLFIQDGQLLIRRLQLLLLRLGLFEGHLQLLIRGLKPFIQGEELFCLLLHFDQVSLPIFIPLLYLSNHGVERPCEDDYFVFSILRRSYGDHGICVPGGDLSRLLCKQFKRSCDFEGYEDCRHKGKKETQSGNDEDGETVRSLKGQELGLRDPNEDVPYDSPFVILDRIVGSDIPLSQK